MRSARRAGLVALYLVLLSATVALAVPPGSPAPAAAVEWPASTALVLSEVVTGGTSASDELVELANVSSAPIDLGGLELAYVTSSGSSVTRKLAFAAGTTIDPGRHLLIANSLGSYLAQADLTYSGGLAASGGALVLRQVGGAVVDAIGWGDASNGFVEGTAAAAPPAGSSIERRPGGADGSGQDTNDNAADWVIRSTPGPQNLASPPTLDVEPTPTATPTPTPTATPRPTPSPTPTPTPTPSTIEAARTLPDGAVALVEGVLTTPLGALDAGRSGFIQDATAGISLYLDAAVAAPVAPGTLVRARGTVGDRYGQRTLRASNADVEFLGTAPLPSPVQGATGLVGESREGSRLSVLGRIVDSASPLSDGTAVTIDDGSGDLRIVVTPEALEALPLERGLWISAVGPLGQRDSSGDGTTGYRVIVAVPGDLQPATDPSPSPEPSPSPDLSPSPEPSPSATPEPESLLTVAEARLLPVGSTARIRGVLTSLPGQIGHPAMVTVQDPTAAIVLRLAEADLTDARGIEVEAVGRLSTYFDQTEIRVAEGDLTTLGSADEPVPAALPAAEIGERVEARLVEVTGTVVTGPTRTTGGDLDVSIEDAAGDRVRVMADGSTELDLAALERGEQVTLRGIVGQRASRKGALDGYRVWLRDLDDVVSKQTGDVPEEEEADDADLPRATPIADALAAGTGRFTVAGVVTAGGGLLDNAGRHVVAQDATAAVELYLPSDHPRLVPGDVITATGTLGLAYGAPRLRVSELIVEDRGPVPAPLTLGRAPRASEVWLLVRLSGVLTGLSRSGDRWRGELAVSGTIAVPVIGLPGAEIDASRLVKGSRLTVTGIVRRPSTGAADQRMTIVPRTAADLVAAAATSPATASSGTGSSGAVPPASATTPPGSPGASAVEASQPQDGPGRVELRELPGLVGRRVQVAGIVVEVVGSLVRIDDGTTSGRVRLDAGALSVIGAIAAGDAVSARGLVIDEDGLLVLVTDPGDLARASRPVAPAQAVADRALAGSTPRAAAPRPAEPGGAGPRATGEPGLPGGPASAGVGSVGLLAGLALAARELRRLRARRGLEARVRRRLDRLSGDAAAPGARAQS